jgi:SSS family solute:Na+ symporter
MTSLDLAIVVVWLTLTLGAGLWAGIHSSSAMFWVNKRSTAVPLLVMTVVTTQVGAGAIIGIAAATKASGTGFGVVSLASTVFGFLAMAFFAPTVKRFGDKFRAVTLPDFFGRRYGRKVQVAAAIVVLFTYLSLLAAQFTASSALIALFTGLDVRVAVAFATVGVIGYSSFAGMRGDIVADALYFCAKVVVLLIIGIPALIRHHGSVVFGAGLPASTLSPLTFGGWPFLVLGLLFGAIIPLLAPEIWMRVFSSRSTAEARKVFLYSAIWVIPFYLFAMMLGFATYANHSVSGSNEAQVLKTLFDSLPHWILGVGVASVLTVIVSTANTLVIVVSGTILRDFLNYDLNAPKSLAPSRWFSLLGGFAGAALALWSGSLVQLLLNTFYGLLVLAAPLVGGVVWRKASASGAFWSIASGFIVTLVCLSVMPTQAFLPGLVVSILVFIIVSKLTYRKAEPLVPFGTFLE